MYLLIQSTITTAHEMTIAVNLGVMSWNKQTENCVDLRVVEHDVWKPDKAGGEANFGEVSVLHGIPHEIFIPPLLEKKSEKRTFV